MRAWLLVPLLLTPGCFLASDLDRFEQDEGCDLALDLDSFTPHTGQRMEIRVVARPPEAPAALRARAIIAALPSPNVAVTMPNAVAAGPHSIDFFADFDMNGVYSPPPDDHTWQIADACADPRNLFVHVFDFDPLDDPAGLGADLNARFTGMEANGNAFELRASALVPQADPDAEPIKRTVALFYTPAVEESDFDLTVEDVIDTGFEYELEYWADRNGNDRYDPPPVDEAWRLTLPGDRLTDFEFARVEEYIDIERILVRVSP